MKKLLCVLSVLLVMAALPALADSISPVSVTATLPVGGSATVHKTVTIEAVVATISYSDVSLDTTEAGLDGSVKFAPGSYIGLFDRSIARTFGFDVTFTGVSEGIHDFNIYALVDGGRVATESDRVTVGAVPEPGSMFLLGTVLVGIAAGLRRRRQ
jgi:PEP-CTERM motif